MRTDVDTLMSLIILKVFIVFPPYIPFGVGDAGSKLEINSKYTFLKTASAYIAS